MSVAETRIGVNGAGGEMGGRVLAAAAERDDVEAVFGVAPGPEAATARIPVVEPDDLGGALDRHAPDVLVDFSVPAATVDAARACAAAGVALVTGTTGLDDRQLAAIGETSAETPVLRASNFSRGIQAFLRALEPVLAALPEYDVELLETHHSRKRDAPSGTAETILETVADHRELERVPGREGAHDRTDEEVGVLVRRAGTIRGEHELLLAGDDEVLTLTHRAEDRGVFAAGALDAAVWIAGRPPGTYSFADVVAD